MNLKYIFLVVLLIVPIASFASKHPAQLHEKVVEKNDNKEIEISTDFHVSNEKDAEQIGCLVYTFEKKSKKGTIDLIEVYKKFQNSGLGTAWFKRAVINLMAYNPKSICWEALPLDHFFSRKDLGYLVRLYKRLGGVIIKMHIDDKHNSVDMQYPMALAHALSILHPIFSSQEQSLVVQKKKDPFALIVAYANIDLNNTDLKEVK